MSRWMVTRDGPTAKPWAAYSAPPSVFRFGHFPTWRQAYQYALTRARQESAESDWTPEPVPMSGREPASRQNPTVNH